MILFNEAIKSDHYKKERKLLKDLIKLRRSQFCADEQKIEISFKLKSNNQWFEDKGMSFIEWQVITAFMVKMGYWKEEEQEEEFLNWIK